ncbi:hypothetical protein C4J96_2771 [Pseudomonas orientalis]|nr:hypothetical protein C4J96_2771 [Pseudomonas orientalis]
MTGLLKKLTAPGVSLHDRPMSRIPLNLTRTTTTTAFGGLCGCRVGMS